MTQQIPEPGPAEDPAAATGFRRLLGYRTAEWREGHAVLEMDLDERHMNRAGVLHGGALATLIDTACGLAATWAPEGAPPRLCVTLSLAVSFAGQAAGGRVRATARLRGGGRRIVFCSAEVTDAAGRLIGMGEGSFRYRASPGTEDTAGDGTGAR
ncbi:PaaI family thioesterase [Paenirhodobacter enshiensis]|uniref:Thioesterase domain-containing protein n=1 Tax=Paenirhodobacter enshiensis TaxID=1105367 RepID=A0A086XXT6_9RHOB|nr:PaaI family thioesterase [Paenirhodobacter enshiensis]KFI26836.1 hypothetical protein CG50_00800 [Paenirhodobacter enshiensis]